MKHSAQDAEVTEVEEGGLWQEEEPSNFEWRSAKGIALLIGAIVVIFALILLVVYLVRANADDEPDPVAVTVPVALSDVAPPDDSSIGVVVTTGSGAAEGSQWHQAAQGAVVAQQRLELGGHEVKLVTETDSGSAEGSAEAVQALVDQGVSGIVYASSGEHLAEGVSVAEDAGVPVVLPYETVPEGATNVWSLAPEAEASASTLAATVAEFERPLHIDAGGELPGDVAVSDAVRFSSDTDADEFAETMALRTGADPFANGAYTGGGEDEQSAAPTVENPADAVVVSGSAAMQAQVVFALQTGNVSVPIVLTPQAVSPSFDQTLLELGGTVSSNLRTVGSTWDDGTALGTSGQSRAMSAFLTANRQFAEGESVMNLSGDAPFAESAAVTDVRSHDAVLALTEALSAAGSRDSAEVIEAMDELQLAAGDGIAGPSLDFSQAHALTAEPTVLHASSQQLGLRPTSGEYTDALVWINQP